MIEENELNALEILETFLNNSLQAQMLINKSGKIMHMNMIAKHILRKIFNFQYDAPEINWKDIIRYSPYANLLQHFELAISGDIQIKEVEFIDHFKNKVWYEFQYFPVYNKEKNINEIILTIIDISDLKKSQIKLNDTLILNQALLEKQSQALLIVDKITMDIEYMNASANKLFNLENNQLSYLNFEKIMPHISWTNQVYTLSDIREKEIKDEAIEFIDFKKRKVYMQIHSRFCEISHRSYIFFFATDISAEKNSIINLNFVQSSIEENAVGIILTDETGNILFANKLIENLCSCENVICQGKNILSCHSKNSEFVDIFVKCIRNKTNWRGKLTSRDTQNRIHTFTVNVSFLKNYEDRIIRYSAVFREITHELELEKQLRQAQKLEAIGTLAGGIAHDFNNILTAILGFTELSMMDAPEDSQLYGSLSQILKASQRAKELIFQILTFSRHNESEFQNIRVSPIVKEAFKLLRASIPVTIKMQQNIRTTDDHVFGDATQIHQIVMNLCGNAYYSMKDKPGSLDLSLENIYLDSYEKHPNLTKPGNYIKLTVCDTGCGIPQDVLDKIFDPYFTTKPTGEGTGLGLAMVQGIISSMQGFIEVESKINEGTTFKIFIPMVQTVQQTVVKDNTVYKGSGQKILFIDDEKSIVEIMEQILKKINYQPVVTIDTDFALKAFLETPNDFSLVITDMTMPKMTGIDFTRKIRQHNPDIPVIICTGYSDLLTDEKIKELNINDFIIKPVTIQEISRKINLILNK